MRTVAVLATTAWDDARMTTRETVQVTAEFTAEFTAQVTAEFTAEFTAQVTVRRGDVRLAVTDRGGAGPAVVLLHGLAGSARELLPTADALTDAFHVLLIDQRGHGGSTRRPADVSRQAYVDDVVAVIEQLLPGQRVSLAGQSMGAHTALLVAAARPDLVDRLVLLEGHVAGSDRAEDARELGAFFASWPTPFSDVAGARAFLGESPLARAWVDALEPVEDGLRPRFDADVMERAIAAVHEPRWAEWEALQVPTLAVFAEHGMFTAAQRDELIRRRPHTRRADIPGAGHDAHLDAFEPWVRILRGFLEGDVGRDRGRDLGRDLGRDAAVLRWRTPAHPPPGHAAVGLAP